MDAKSIASARFHDLFKLFMIPSQLSGVTMFTLDSSTNFHFSFWSCTFLTLVIRSVLVMLVVSYQARAKEAFGPSFGLRSETVNFVTEVLTYNVLMEGMVGDLAIFFRRQKTISFQQNLKNTLLEFVDGDSSLQAFQELMDQAYRRISIILKILLVMFIYNVVVLPLYFVFVIVGTREIFQVWDVFPLFLLVCTWTGVMYLRYLRRLWFVCCLHCLKTCVALTFGQREILKNCGKLEDLVNQFSMTFGQPLTVDMMGLIITQIMNCFLLGMFLIMGDYGPLLTTVMCLAINSSVIFIICHVAEEFHLEIKKLGSSLKPRTCAQYPSQTDMFKLGMLNASWNGEGLELIGGSVFKLNRNTFVKVKAIDKLLAT